jgi:hypothetical protein
MNFLLNLLLFLARNHAVLLKTISEHVYRFRKKKLEAMKYYDKNPIMSYPKLIDWCHKKLKWRRDWVHLLWARGFLISLESEARDFPLLASLSRLIRKAQAHSRCTQSLLDQTSNRTRDKYFQVSCKKLSRDSFPWFGARIICLGPSVWVKKGLSNRWYNFRRLSPGHWVFRR